MTSSAFPGGDEQRRALVQKLLEQRGIRRTATAAIAPRPAGPIPLSFPQQRLWFVHQLDPRTSAYNLTAALKLSGDLDVEALRLALAAVVARHDALRMAFATVNGEAVVERRERIDVELPIVDLSAEPEPLGRADARLLEHAHAPFDLARAPLFRAQLLKVAARQHILVLTAHHIVFDGWSIALFVKELAAFYRGAPLPPLPIGYADFAAWQRARHASGAFDADLAYWTTQLADLPQLDLPADRPRPAVSTFAGGSHTFSLEPALISRLGALAGQTNATLFMALAAGFAVLLGRYANQTDVAIGSPIAGRSVPELEGLIGLFANTLVLRTDLSGRPTFRALLERVRRMTLEAYAHQDAPFEYLVERMRPERRLSEQPLFQVALAMQHEGIGALTLPGLDVTVIDVPSDSSKFDLTVALTEERGGISGSAEFSTDLFDASTIERMLDSYRTLLEAAAAAPDTSIDRLPLLSPAQRRAVLDIWTTDGRPEGLHYDRDEGASDRAEVVQAFRPAVAGLPEVVQAFRPAVAGLPEVVQAFRPAVAGLPEVVQAFRPAVADLLHQSFERQVPARPDTIAVRCDDRELTYDALNRRANRLARYLRRRGIGLEDRVGLYLDRSIDTVVAILAVLKTGAAYVPVDPVNPAERTSLIIEDAGVRLLLSDTALRSRLPTLSMPVALLDTIEAELRAEPDDNLDVTAPPSSLAYIIYTSGSTGRPKGVLIQHDHVQRLFSSTDRWFGFGDADVWTLFHSYGFDFSVWEIWGALLHGGRLIVVPYLVSRSPAEFHALIAREGVTVLNQTPSAFAQLIGADAAADRPLALRWVIFGGEALDPETLRPWFERHGDARPRLVNMYGITETTVHVTYRPIAMADLDARAGSVIGRPIPDLRLLVLDRELEPVPFGVAGELFVGGAGVGRGYLDRPDLTAEKFVPDPSGDGGRLYRSGDLARLSPRGDLTYLGRIDHQVKIRGFRIEVGEIENALSSHPGVRDAAVLALERDAADGGDRRLVGYVAPRDGGAPTPASLREHLQSRLPDYMIPAAFVVLEALPLTAHGKVDRRALPAPAIERADLSSGYDAPANEAERRLAAVWTEVLHVDRVGRHDNFFELGGDSIRSIRVLALARERGVDATLQQLFQHQTIAGIAAAVGGAPAADAPAHGPAPFALIDPDDRRAIAARFGDAIDDAYPLSRLQEGMLFHGAFHEGSTAYHNVSSFHLQVRFDETALRQAVDGLVARHPILRTSLHPAGFSRPLQIVHRSIELPLVIEDWRQQPEASRRQRVDAWLEAERGRHFEWTQAPLFRLHVQRLTGEEIQITLSEHHAILDGWSVAALLSELMTEYLGAIGVAPAATPSAPVARFADHVAVELEAIAGNGSRAFWDARLGDAAAPPLPVLAPPRAPGLLVHEAAVTADVAAGLERLAHAANVPFRTTLLAAHARVMTALQGQTDLVTGLVVNTRPETVDGDRALGLFLNTVPLRLRLDGGSWRALCHALFAEERALLPHRAYPLAELQRRRGGAPLFRTAFNYVHFHVYDAVSALPGMTLLGQSGSAETDLPLAASFSRDVATGAVRLSLECADTGIDGAALARIAGYYFSTLAAIASDPLARYDAFSPLSADEIQRIRAASRGARIANGALAPTRVSAQARTRPDAIAIVSGEQQVTFAELDARATRRAHQFKAAGIGPESRVALLSSATPDLIVGMLAAWRAGAAFVPIDPADPERRIRFMLDDASPAAVLTEDNLRDTDDGSQPVVGTFDDLDPDSPAYVIYTSGSTGTPKGVVATHRGLANLLDGQIPRFGLTTASRVLQFAALGFDASISEIFTTLAAGGTLVLAPRADLRVPDRLASLLRDHAITVVTLPPTMLAVLAPEGLSALSTVVSAGEACRADLVRRWAPGRRFLNAYGPTETTVCATMSAPLAASADGDAPIGWPLDNLDAWVLDRALLPVPTGSTGELYVGGDSVARGYLGRPDLTAERFVPHPFAGTPGARLYRTGDLARWRADGGLEFIGRADSQVKIRGVRVELGEIEAVLRRHPDVRHAAVVLDDGGGGAARLAAYIEHGGRAPSIDELRRHLAGALSDRVVPASIVVLDALPLTPSGKLDRRALPALVRPELDQAYVAPDGGVASTLAEIWTGVLALDRVGAHDNFFSLGGDSILSLQVVARARARGIRITPQQVFEHQTIAALAGVAGAVGAIAAAAPDGDTILAPIQRWFFELDVPSPQHWNQALLFEVAADVDRDALARACESVFAHHEAFRQRFVRDETGWRQITAAAPDPITLERIDLARVADEDRAAAMREHSDEAQRSLDLARGPLARAVLYDAGAAAPGRLLLIAHHLIVDGVSWRILLDDLQSAYDQARGGATPVLPAATSPFAAWTAALSSPASLERMRESAGFWRDTVRAGANVSPFDCSAADPRNTEGNAASIDTWLDEIATRDLLQSVPRAFGVHAQEAMVTAAAQALAPPAGTSAILFAIESHGRDAEAEGVDLARTVGWFTAMYPLALEVAAGDSPSQALQRARTQLRAVPGNGVAYGWLRYTAPDEELRGALRASPDVSFNYLGRLDAALDASSPFRPAREPLGPMRDPAAHRPHLLDIVCSVEGGRLRVSWLYPERLMARERIEALAAAMLARLRAMIAAVADAEPESIDDRYALTAMQHGMLFQALYAPGSGVYVQQVAARLRGSLDAALFRRAWEALLDRHDVLRTAFDWELGADPIQTVHHHAALPWTEEDWSREDESEQRQRLAQLLAADRGRGFDLRRPPLMRVFLARTGADAWQLVWTHHHLILDGWSVPLLLHDLFGAYRALLDGRQPAFEPRRPFRDHVAWLGAQDGEAARAYWSAALRGLERPRAIASSPAAGAAFAGSLHHVSHRLSEDATTTLTAFARASGLTLSTVVQGAWAMVVAAYSNAREALYGVTVGGRPAALSGADRMVGLFINTLPVRVEPRPGAPLVPWLRDLQQTLARHRDFEHTPLVDILGWSPLGRRPGAIESLFVFENYPIDPAAAASVPGLTIEEADAHEQTDFALTVVAVPGRELLLKIDAAATAFALEDAERLLAALADTLEAFPDAADAPLGTVMPAAGVERWNQTARDWPDDRSIHELIDAQADRDPAAIAVRDAGRLLTFGELRDASTDVAAMLIAKGVGADHRVGVALPRSVELIVALVGVLKAGAAYVPLDPALPEARRRALIDDAGIAVAIDAGDRWPAGARVALPRVTPDALAYVLYTSGSTGTPKGVMVTHRGLANYVRWAREAYAADRGDGALLHSPIGFDLTVTSLFPLLAAGRPVTIVSQEAGLDGLAAALAAGADYSLVKITPAHLDALRQLAPELRGATRAFVIGGDALTYDQLAHWRQAAPGTRLLNEYGPTETVVGCALHDATADFDDRGPVPIGAPIANTRLYVLDRALNAAPAGVTGELFIAGDGVARGYQGRPDLTAAAFLPDPFSPTAGARMYRSGDLARRRADGALEFLGRADDQLKIRGYRIEPGEVEAALLSEPGVREAAVVAHAAASGERQLAAFVVTSDPARDLRAYLRERLPDHLVPATVTRVDRLPLTANGKIDRALLARTPLTQAARDRAGDPPRGAAEELLAAIWSDVLQVDGIGRSDNFFDLGGHSLLATRIVARARLAFGGQLALRDIFDTPTIAGLAARIGRSGEDSAGGAIEPRPAGEAPTLSFAQQRLWILEQLDPNGAAYLVPAALRVEGPLRVDAFRAALAAVVARHESLRTAVRAEEGAPVASVVASCQAPFTVVDLSDRPPADQESEVSRLAGIDARTPFDLARPPLMRATLLRLGDRHHVLLLAMHHLVSDAWSVDLLVQEIAAAYATPDAGAALPALAVQYADIARWQRRRLEGPALDRLVAAMTAKLAGVPVLELPADRRRPPISSPRGSSVTVSLPAGAVALVTTARAENASPFMAFLAAFEVLLARYSGQRDFAVGTPVSGRDRLESERLIGLFMNTLVLRSDVGTRSTFVDVVRGVRGTLLHAQAHQELPFDRLVDALQPERALGHNPLFQVMFTLQHEPPPLDVAGLRVTPIDGGATTAKFDLSLSVNQTTSGWQATFEYRTDLFDEPTIAAMAHLYGRIVAEAARQPRSEVFRLPWLDEAERQAVIEAGNDTQHGDGDGPDVWEAIARQAALTPDATALMFEDKALTYAELMTRVHARASALRADGVGPESIVPLSLERSIDLVVSMLAVLAAGGTYAPLDPAAPPERLTAMLAAIEAAEPRRQTVSDAIGHRSWHGDTLAYVIFTSGSTGTPKGVGIPRRALANHMRWMQRAFPLSPGDRVLQKTPAIFDASVWEFFAPLLAGATLVVAAPGAHQDPDALIAAVERYQITTLQAVPSMLGLLVDDDRLRRCRSLRRVFAGGEALSRDLQDRFFAASSAELVNLYGPTEVTIDSVVWRCERGDPHERVPIGLPIDNTTAYALDDRLEPVPAGVAGELYLGGAGVARGYIGQPSLTAERFVPDPYSSTPGAVCYRTGDLVRRRADGVLEYLGRADQQVKLRGFRIELGEIERALESYPAVLQAAVLVDETPSRRRLVGYTVARDRQRVDADALHAHLAARLPDYMIPAAFVVLDRLPRLPSGKLDRRALPAPPDAVTTTGGAAPRDDREQILAGIWSAVLGIPAPGIRDNFFSLGGDSILALQVVARARKAGLLVTPAQLFVHQTIETLAAAATTGSHASSAAGPDDDSGPLPLTPVQRWFFELPLEDRHHWNQAMLLTTPIDLDRTALEQAIDDLMARHDALRLRFVADDRSWRQEYGAPGAAFEMIDLSREAEPAAALARDIDRIQRSLSLDAAPLLRVAWFDYGARPGRLLIVAHHLVVDGVSWRILLEDLRESYESRRSTAMAHSASDATSFRAWTRRLDDVARSSELDDELAYWQSQLEPSPAPLPLDGDAADGNLEADARHVELELSELQTDALLHALPAAMHTQVIDVLLAALAEALAPWTGSRVLTVELEAHGRDAFDLDVSQTVGWFTALFPLRLDTRGTTAPDRLLRAVRDQLRAVPRKGAGFGLLRYSGSDRPGRASLATQPPPSISFNYLGQWPSAPRRHADDTAAGFGPAPEEVGRARSARSPRTHILEIVAGVVDRRLRLRWTYGERLHARGTIAALADAYVGALDAIAAHCLGAGGASYTPSDFTAADLDQSELDKLLSKLRGS